MADFIEAEGLPFMAHLLRRLADDFVRNIGAWYEEIGVEAPPRTHSTMLALARNGPMGVTEIASLLRQSHPLVITWVRQLKALGFVEMSGDPADRRRTVVRLTAAGETELRKHRQADAIVARTYAKLMAEAGAEVFEGLWRIEAACRARPMIDRLRDEHAGGRR